MHAPAPIVDVTSCFKFILASLKQWTVGGWRKMAQLGGLVALLEMPGSVSSIHMGSKEQFITTVPRVSSALFWLP